MTLEKAKKDMERFVSLKTSMRPAFVDVLLQAEEVVRCKDCQYSRPKKSGIKLHCAWWYRSVEDEDFCSRGERREDADT